MHPHATGYSVIKSYTPTIILLLCANCHSLVETKQPKCVLFLLGLVQLQMCAAFAFDSKFDCCFVAGPFAAAGGSSTVDVPYPVIDGVSLVKL